MRQKGLTLIELLVALTITGILGAGVYRTFIGQQHTYEVQDQVVDLQQNVRMAINQLVRDIRMAGFGRIDSKTFGVDGMHGNYKSIISASNDGKSLTVIAGYQAMTTLDDNGGQQDGHGKFLNDIGAYKVKLKDASGFSDQGGKRYICINGTESHRIQNIVGNVVEFFTDAKDDGRLLDQHYAGEPVFMVKALTYSLGMSDGKMCLLRDEHLGAGPQPVAENIEDIQFRYTLREDDGSLVVYDNVPNNKCDKIRMIQVRIVAKTDRQDPEILKAGDGYRRRVLTSEIQLRNLISM
jgi:prepilin-type N-terminal cleavage/methylation domain-containing protein